MDIEKLDKQLIDIERNLDNRAYSIVATESIRIIEAAFREIYQRDIRKLPSQERTKILRFETSKHDNGIDGFTLGETIGLFFNKETRFFDVWAKTAGKNEADFKLINFNELNKLRIKLLHDNDECTEIDAKLIFRFLRIVLQAFDIKDFDFIGEKSSAQSSRCL